MPSRSAPRTASRGRLFGGFAFGVGARPVLLGLLRGLGLLGGGFALRGFLLGRPALLRLLLPRRRRGFLPFSLRELLRLARARVRLGLLFGLGPIDLEF